MIKEEITCDKCGKGNLIKVFGNCIDAWFEIYLENGKFKEYDRYIPRDIGIGSGDDMEFIYCMDCGRIQGKFPLAVNRVDLTS